MTSRRSGSHKNGRRRFAQILCRSARSRRTPKVFPPPCGIRESLNRIAGSTREEIIEKTPCRCIEDVIILGVLRLALTPRHVGARARSRMDSVMMVLFHCLLEVFNALLNTIGGALVEVGVPLAEKFPRPHGSTYNAYRSKLPKRIPGYGNDPPRFM
jgi:hypothetical protein